MSREGQFLMSPDTRQRAFALSVKSPNRWQRTTGGGRTADLRMWGNGDNRDFVFIRAIVPKDSIGPRRLVLGIRLIDLLFIRSTQGIVRMRIQSWVAGIYF